MLRGFMRSGRDCFLSTSAKTSVDQKRPVGVGLPQSNPLPAKPAMSFISFAPGASSKLGIKKPLILCMKGLLCGGLDGTRTRDPLRDRQVF